jgi:hypothetical protein
MLTMLSVFGPPLTLSAKARYTETMRVVGLRFLLPIVLVLVAATIAVSLNFEDDADLMAWQGQTQILRANTEEQVGISVTAPRPIQRPSPADLDSVLHLRTSVPDVLFILRC